MVPPAGAEGQASAPEQPFEVTVALEFTLRVLAPDAEEARRIALVSAEFVNQCIRWDELRQWQEVQPVGLVVDPTRAIARLAKDER